MDIFIDGSVYTMTPTEVDAELQNALDASVANAKKRINTACEQSIISGFNSNALGTLHQYQSNRDDQTNLLGIATSPTNELIKCFDGTSWDYRSHTPAEIAQVIDDGRAFKYARLLQANNLKNQIDTLAQSASSIKDKIDDVEMVTWVEPA